MKFNSQNPIDSSPNENATNANETQINDYNSLRKTKTYYDANKKQNINNLRSHYQHLGL